MKFTALKFHNCKIKNERKYTQYQNNYFYKIYIFLKNYENVI